MLTITPTTEEEPLSLPQGMIRPGPSLVVYVINCRGVVRPNKYTPSFQKVKKAPDGQVYHSNTFMCWGRG